MLAAYLTQSHLANRSLTPTTPIRATKPQTIVVISLYRTAGATLLLVDAVGAVPVCCNPLPLPLPLPLLVNHSHSHSPTAHAVDVAGDIDVVSGVGIGDVSSDTADAASPLAASVQHPIATVTTAVRSSDAPPQPSLST